MKNYLLITILAITSLKAIAQQISATTPKEKIKVKNETLKTNLTRDSIMSYIKSLSKSNKPFRNEFIMKVEENMKFDKMYMERRYDNQKFIIIPMKNIYFSQHAINQKNAPIQYVVIVEKDNDRGKIWRADLILVFPKDNRITVLPKNAFLDFSSQNITQIDATYTYVNFGDVKQGETVVENGRRTKTRLWSSKNTEPDNCKDWSLETSTTNKNGTNTHTKKKLGKTCTECPPSFKCDSIKK